jgi:hypothetical protein
VIPPRREDISAWLARDDGASGLTKTAIYTVTYTARRRAHDALQRAAERPFRHSSRLFCKEAAMNINFGSLGAIVLLLMLGLGCASGVEVARQDENAAVGSLRGCGSPAAAPPVRVRKPAPVIGMCR